MLMKMAHEGVDLAPEELRAATGETVYWLSCTVANIKEKVER